VLIDATGNAAFSALAGAPLLAAAPENRQLGGFVVQVQGCRGDDMTAVSVPYLLHKAAGEGIVPPSFRFTAWEPEIGSPDRGFLKFSVPPAGDLPPALVREFSERAIAYLRAHLPAFAAASVERTSGRVFAREGSRIQGEYVLTEEDVLNGRKFDDGLVKNAWPIEFWDPRRGPVYKYLIEGDYYEIPFRCLRPVGMLNLLAAGMCLSSTQAAHASARVVGPCIALGEKAGQAAAMFAGTGEWKPDRLSHS